MIDHIYQYKYFIAFQVDVAYVTTQLLQSLNIFAQRLNTTAYTIDINPRDCGQLLTNSIERIRNLLFDISLDGHACLIVNNRDNNVIKW